ncbi:MAG TPA: hypothetical protein DCM28_05185 [Phycisphaerales bacterium]|nr:hypothetical protein [Phycisphaerales bacterium]HCD32291.1 hypothetical protein [Phycisphaerales bacterium]
MGNTYTGMGGTVDGANTVRTWSTSETEENKPYNASNTLGGTGQLGGIKDWSGSYTQYGHTPTHFPGDTITFVGFDGANKTTGSAIISQVEITANQESGDIESITVTLAGNGALTHTTGTITDSTLPNPPSSLSLKVELAETDTFTELDDVRSWTLTIACDLKEYASSSTSGWKKRKAGNITASGSISFYNQDVRTAPDIGDVRKLRLYVTSTLFYLIHWARFGEGAYETSIEGAELASGTANWNWSGFNAGVAGTITKPDTTEWWPAA